MNILMPYIEYYLQEKTEYTKLMLKRQDYISFRAV